MLVVGTKEPHSREEALGWLEQKMGAHVDSTYGTGMCENEKTMERCHDMEPGQCE